MTIPARRRHDVHFSSDRQDWNTPAHILELVRAVGPIGLDPCSNAESIVGATVEWDGSDRVSDGMIRNWRTVTENEGGLVFVNPPYGRELPKWIARCQEQAERGVEVIALIPARPDTAAWHKHIFPHATVCFLKGRIRFVGAPGPAPFPSAVVYWGHRRRKFIDAFASAGAIWS